MAIFGLGSGGTARLAVATVAALAFLIAPAQVAAQSVGQCELVIGGVPLSQATRAPEAIQVDAGSSVQLVAVSTVPGTLGLAIGFGPLAWQVFEGTLEPADATRWQWSGNVDVSTYARLGVGLYELRANAGGCEVSGWVNVTGKPAFETPLGWTAIGVILAGLLLVGRGLLAIRRGGGGLVRAMVGGGATGLGLLLFAQQAGVSEATPTSAAVWVVLPSVVGAAVHSVVRLAAGQVSASARRVGAATAPTATVPTGTAPTATAPTATAPTASARPAGVASESSSSQVSRPGPGPEPETARVPSASPTPAVATAATGATVTAVDPTRDDPPRVSYARVDCPEAVVAEVEFELIVGLAPSPDPLVVGDPLRRPPSSVGPYFVTIQVIADGFSVRASERWRVDLPVTVQQPYPAATLHLVAAQRARPIAPASIRAMYSVDGHPIGLAVRPLAVVRNAALIDQAPPRPASPAVDMSIPTGESPPDLTVRIERAESQASGRLLLQLLAADPSVPVPSAPMIIDIGGDPASDLRRIIDEMNAVEGKPTQFVSLRGIGLAISDQLPDAFWDVVRDVAARVKGRPPMILILSAEPYVPWELAVVDPPLDPSAPPFLSAQANVGRWVLGQRRPKLPPPSALSVRALAVVSGVYDLPGWERLVEAEGEAGDIVDAYGATAVNATLENVLDLLRGTPAADLIHFAVHGAFDGTAGGDGLVLVDGNALDALAVRGTPMSGTPFVFLNACQVGRGDQILGDHAGMASAFLFAGAAGVVAPLWSIDDRLARQIALRFYERALDGDSAANVLRTERAAFRDSPESVSSTYLAYQYFGHPALRLERARSSPEGSLPGSVETPAGT